MDIIDHLFRETLINWALEDREDSVRRDALLRMGSTDWVDHLYCQPKPPVDETRKRPIMDFLIDILESLQQEYGHLFHEEEWKVQHINTTGFFKIGPLAHIQFRVGIRGDVVFYDIRRGESKVKIEKYPAFPAIIAQMAKKRGMDFLVRTNRKGYGRSIGTGTRSKLLHTLLDLINTMVKGVQGHVGNDAHGHLYLYASKKKVVRLEPIWKEEGWKMRVIDIRSGDLIDMVHTASELSRLKVLFSEHCQ